MRVFIKRIILFLLLTVVFIETISEFMLVTDLYLIGYPGRDIYYSIFKSKKKNKSGKLLLGDSVGRQIFSNKTNNNGINSLACNQAIGMVGQYLLLNNYINSGNKIDTLILMFTPFTFLDNLDQIYTFHYFLKPFDKAEYSGLFTKTVKKQINKIPYHQFVKVPHILATSWAPDFKSSDKKDYKLISPISTEYLRKIKQLSILHNFKLILHPTPVGLNKKELLRNLDYNEFKKCNLEKEFKDYFSKIIYLDSTYFYDGIHLKQPGIYTEIYKKELMK